jgi:hypothetical protein
MKLCKKKKFNFLTEKQKTHHDIITKKSSRFQITKNIYTQYKIKHLQNWEKTMMRWMR